MMPSLASIEIARIGMVMIIPARLNDGLKPSLAAPCWPDYFTDQ
jgi:hypothetical protein